MTWTFELDDRGDNMYGKKNLGVESMSSMIATGFNFVLK
jgi:hypothetical protein